MKTWDKYLLENSYKQNPFEDSPEEEIPDFSEKIQGHSWKVLSSRYPGVKFSSSVAFLMSPKCKYCVQTESALNTMADKYGVNVVSINIQEDIELMFWLGVDLVPISLFFKNGDHVGTIIGADNEGIEENLKKIAR